MSPPPRHRRQPRSLRSTLGLFLLWNMLPLGALVVVLVLHLRGEIEIRELPSGFTQNLIVLGVVLLTLLVVASFSLPTAHAWVRGLERAIQGRSAVLAGREAGSKFLALLVLPGLALLYLGAWPLRGVMILLSFLLISLAVVCLVRLFQPEFLQEQLDQILGWHP